MKYQLPMCSLQIGYLALFNCSPLVHNSLLSLHLSLLDDIQIPYSDKCRTNPVILPSRSVHEPT